MLTCDKILKSGLKEILQIPIDIPDHMIYSARKHKGLGLFRAQWEASLQHINICNILQKENNLYLNHFRNFKQECSSCLQNLDLQFDSTFQDTRTSLLNVKKIRHHLQDRESLRWCDLPHKGRGVTLYRQYTPANRWISDNKGLSCSEWREAIKMTANVSAVRSLPGRSQDGSLCRRCHREYETLAHVLGACPYGEVLRNSRHHRVRSMMAQALRDEGYTVYEEVPGLANSGSNRRIDIIAFKPPSKNGFILDPTVRFETSLIQPEEIDIEKQAIYNPTVDYYKQKYNLDSIFVKGLMVGARGTIPTFLSDFWRSFGLPKHHLQEIAVAALRGSVALLGNHLYLTT